MATIYQLVGDRLRRAREARGLSQADLAEALGYQSGATISHFEAGERRISIHDLDRAARKLTVPMEYFLHGHEMPESMDYLRMRALQVHPSAREAVVEFLMFSHQSVREPASLLHELGGSSPGVAAIRLLEATEITAPPVSPPLVAEKLNIPIFEWTFPEEISGIAMADEGKVGIGVNDRHPRVRQRFSAAHEIGHLVLDWDPAHRFDRIDYTGMEMMVPSEGSLRIERRANWFAADLLMPARWIRRDSREFAGQMDEGSLTVLAKRYDVSQQALWFRLLSLKLVDGTSVSTSNSIP